MSSHEEDGKSWRYKCINCCFGCIGSTILACFVCRKCGVDKVAGEFAFLPPPKQYKVVKRLQQDGEGPTYELELGGDLALSDEMREARDACEVHLIPTRLGETIVGMHLRAESTAPHANLTIVFVHGNAMDCAVLLGFWRFLTQQLGCNVFALEYSGYGGSTGAPSVQNTLADIEACYEYLTGDLGVDPMTLIMYGQSVGTGPVCHIASTRPVLGVILHSPLKTGLQVIAGPPACCNPSCMFQSCDVFKNIEKIDKIDAPVLVIHGMADEVIDFSHGMDLYHHCQRPVEPYWVPDAKHNDVIEVNPTKYFARMAEFLDACAPAAGQSTSVEGELRKAGLLNPVSQEP